MEKWFNSTPVHLAPHRLLGLLVLLLEISIPASWHPSAVSIIQDHTLVPMNAILWLPSLRVLSLTYGTGRNFSLWVSISSDSKPVVPREITHKSSFLISCLKSFNIGGLGAIYYDMSFYFIKLCIQNVFYLGVSNSYNKVCCQCQLNKC